MPTLDFKGKPFVYSHHLSVPFRELKIDAGKSLPGDGGPSLDDNLIIHGDNLHALKALLPKYAGKVDVIYIDPPYNTGNEGWAYNDNVNSPLMKEWLGDVVDGDDLERHDKWLCMMWPRLVLLRELLSEKGTIWISCDDNEVDHLSQIVSEIFGRDNLAARVIWQKKYSRQNDSKLFSTSHDYIFCLSKNLSEWSPNKIERSEKQKKGYSNPDNDPRGDWQSVVYTCSKTRSERPNLYYPITNPKTKNTVLPNENRVWGYEESTHLRHVAENRLWWGKNQDYEKPRLKSFLNKAGNGIVPDTLWMREDVGDNQDAKREVQTIFSEDADAFATPKPTKLIERIIHIAGNENSIILDSFAGSGTTAHAVQALNAEDGGKRKFILVETEGYADNITAERVRRVIKGVPNAKDEALKNGLGGSFTYCDLGDPINMESFFGGSDSMPAYDQLASYIAYTATGEALGKPPKKPAKDWFIGEVGGVRLYLIYKPNSAFMKGHNAALDMDTVKTIAAGNKTGKPSYVFAAAKYMGQNELTRDYDMTFCQLPYAIHRIMGDGVDG